MSGVNSLPSLLSKRAFFERGNGARGKGAAVEPSCLAQLLISFLSFFFAGSSFFCLSPVFQGKISRQDPRRATIPASVDL
jgi:hypothetical protein